MPVTSFRRASMPEAMTVVRAELGPDALIVSSRRIGAEIEVTAAIEPTTEPPSPPMFSREARSLGTG